MSLATAVHRPMGLVVSRRFPPHRRTFASWRLWPQPSISRTKHSLPSARGHFQLQNAYRLLFVSSILSKRQSFPFFVCCCDPTGHWRRSVNCHRGQSPAHSVASARGHFGLSKTPSRSFFGQQLRARHTGPCLRGAYEGAVTRAGGSEPTFCANLPAVKNTPGPGKVRLHIGPVISSRPRTDVPAQISKKSK